MLSIQNMGYLHPGKDVAFSNINFTIYKQQKAALIGNNGVGKSTLLKLTAGLLQPTTGNIIADGDVYYIPQHTGQYNHYSIALALGIENKLQALQEILNGNANDHYLIVLNDDWTIEERCREALAYWGLNDIDLNRKMESLSGGQKTKVFLAGIFIHRPSIILMDEPSNHLDMSSRELLYNFIQTTTATIIVVSHDKKLLNQLNTVYELTKQGITTYGGNYDFYTEQKIIEKNALQQDIKSKGKALRKTKQLERNTNERQQKLDARGKKKQEKAGLPTIAMKTFKNNAEKSTARIKDIHAGKVNAIFEELNELKKELPDMDQMKLGFDNSSLHKGKILATAKRINFSYDQKSIWKEPLSFLITSGERIAIKGNNGSGKTTLINLLLNTLKPQTGSLQTVIHKAVYIDQDYSLLNNNLNIYDQAQQFNSGTLQEHEIKTRLNRFLFTKDDWDKPCAVLSGGEKMRLLLCCLTIDGEAPDVIILDEPTNNLDIQNTEILTAAVSDYQGTLLVISHDHYFLEQLGITREIELG